MREPRTQKSRNRVPLVYQASSLCLWFFSLGLRDRNVSQVMGALQMLHACRTKTSRLPVSGFRVSSLGLRVPNLLPCLQGLGLRI